MRCLRCGAYDVETSLWTTGKGLNRVCRSCELHWIVVERESDCTDVGGYWGEAFEATGCMWPWGTFPAIEEREE